MPRWKSASRREEVKPVREEAKEEVGNLREERKGGDEERC